MERPVFKPLGTPSEELDTPSLVIDLDVLESNIDKVHGFFAESEGSKLRPRLDSHLCNAIGHMQWRAGGTVGGEAVSTISQAESFSQHGFEDLSITNVAVTASKIRRVATLAKRVNLTVGSDSAANVDDLADAAVAADAELGVAVLVRTGNDAIGVTPSAAAEIAARIETASSLRFAGLVSTGLAVYAEDRDERAALTASEIEPLLEAAVECRKAGFEPPTIASAGSANYDCLAAIDGVTEVIAGSYALMDSALAASRSELAPAARILTTVMSHQDHGLVWLDAGQKATSIDTGMPSVPDVSGGSVPRMSAEHGSLVLDEGASWELDLGAKVWLVPHSIANTVNVYDFIHVVRNGRLEAVWDVSARGLYE